MKFETYPEPFVTGAAVRAHMGDVSSVTLWRWCQEGCPYHMTRNGRRLYLLSEVEAWMFESACTATPPGDGTDEEVVA